MSNTLNTVNMLAETAAAADIGESAHLFENWLSFAGTAGSLALGAAFAGRERVQEIAGPAIQRVRETLSGTQQGDYDPAPALVQDTSGRTPTVYE